MNLPLSTTFDLSEKTVVKLIELVTLARDSFTNANMLIMKHSEKRLPISDLMMKDYKSSRALADIANIAWRWEDHEKNTENSISLEWLLNVQSYSNGGRASGWFAEFMKIVMVGDLDTED